MKTLYPVQQHAKGSVHNIDHCMKGQKLLVVKRDTVHHKQEAGWIKLVTSVEYIALGRVNSRAAYGHTRPCLHPVTAATREICRAAKMDCKHGRENNGSVKEALFRNQSKFTERLGVFSRI